MREGQDDEIADTDISSPRRVRCGYDELAYISDQLALPVGRHITLRSAR